MTKYERTPAPEKLKNCSLEQLLHLWDFTTQASYIPALPIVRGWIMDELEARNPDGFNAWLEQDAPRDEDLCAFIFRFPTLTKQNARIGGYYAFGNGYQIVKRIYRLTEQEAEDMGCMYLDRVTTDVGDFALSGSDIYRRKEAAAQ